MIILEAFLIYRVQRGTYLMSHLNPDFDDALSLYPQKKKKRKKKMLYYTYVAFS